MRKKHKIMIVLATLITVASISMAIVWFCLLNNQEFKVKRDISRMLKLPVSISNVFVDEYSIVWQDYGFACRACIENCDDEDINKMIQQGWKKSKLPDELYLKSVAFYYDYWEDIMFYDENYECLWIYIDTSRGKTGNTTLLEEEYLFRSYVFAFYVPERNLLYYRHEQI